jgi:hypothetical protein
MVSGLAMGLDTKETVVNRIFRRKALALMRSPLISKSVFSLF